MPNIHVSRSSAIDIPVSETLWELLDDDQRDKLIRDAAVAHYRDSLKWSVNDGN
jgi:hypothetical protein